MNKELKDKLIGYFQKRHFAISYKELDEIYGLITQQAVEEEREKWNDKFDRILSLLEFERTHADNDLDLTS